MKFTYCLLAGAVLLASCAHQPDAPKPHTAPDVPMTIARIDDVEQTVSATGRVGGVNGSQTKIGFAVPGVIRNVYVHIGDRVSVGEELAVLDGRGYDLAAAQASADVSVAAANARQAAVDRYSTRIAVDEAALRRAQSMYAAGVAPRKDIDAAQAQLAQDRADAAASREQQSSNTAQVQSAQVRQAIAERDVANTTLRAPSEGIVTAIYHRPGENIDQSDPIVALSPAAVDEVTLSVSANDIANLHAGDAVQFTILGTEMHSSGRVTGAPNAIDPTTQTATVVARGIPTGAPIGSVIQASVVVAHRRGVVIPQSAIVQDPQTGNSVTFVSEPSNDGGVKFEQRIVRVAMRNDSFALIATGLHAGEKIAARGGFALLAPSDSGGD
jgi:multidrug efflux pump subunit AcrA (membrane-fusion protein)